MVLADPPAPDVVGLRFGLELKDDPARESQIDVPWVFFFFCFSGHHVFHMSAGQ